METKDQQIKDRADIEAIIQIMLAIGIPYDPRVRTGKIRATALVDAYNQRAWKLKDDWKWPGIPEYISGIASFAYWQKGPTTFLNLGEIHNYYTVCPDGVISAVDFLESLISAQTRGLGRKVHLFIEETIVLRGKRSEKPWSLEPDNTTLSEACEDWKRYMFSNLTACRTRFQCEAANAMRFKKLLEVHRTDSRFVAIDGTDHFGKLWKMAYKHITELRRLLPQLKWNYNAALHFSKAAKTKWNSLSVLHNPSFCKMYLLHFINFELESLSDLLKTNKHNIYFTMLFDKLKCILENMDDSDVKRVKDLAIERFDMFHPLSIIDDAVTSLNGLNDIQDGEVVSESIIDSMIKSGEILYSALEQCGVMCVDTFMFLKLCKLQKEEPHALFLSISGNYHAEIYNYFCYHSHWTRPLFIRSSKYDGCLKIEVGGGRAELDAALRRPPPAEECQPAAKRAHEKNYDESAAKRARK